jgi:hypothetical protein
MIAGMRAGRHLKISKSAVAVRDEGARARGDRHRPLRAWLSASAASIGTFGPCSTAGRRGDEEKQHEHGTRCIARRRLAAALQITKILARTSAQSHKNHNRVRRFNH